MTIQSEKDLEWAAAVNAAELRGQDTGYALAMSRVRAWAKKHEISESALEELELDELFALWDKAPASPPAVSDRTSRRA